jgi:hypothetical protein
MAATAEEAALLATAQAQAEAEEKKSVVVFPERFSTSTRN